MLPTAGMMGKMDVDAGCRGSRQNTSYSSGGGRSRCTQSGQKKCHIVGTWQFVGQICPNKRNYMKVPICMYLLQLDFKTYKGLVSRFVASQSLIFEFNKCHGGRSGATRHSKL
jgi:hypothetical protein